MLIQASKLIRAARLIHSVSRQLANSRTWALVRIEYVHNPTALRLSFAPAPNAAGWPALYITLDADAASTDRPASDLMLGVTTPQLLAAAQAHAQAAVVDVYVEHPGQLTFESTPQIRRNARRSALARATPTATTKSRVVGSDPEALPAVTNTEPSTATTPVNVSADALADAIDYIDAACRDSYDQRTVCTLNVQGLSLAATDDCQAAVAHTPNSAISPDHAGTTIMLSPFATKTIRAACPLVERWVVSSGLSSDAKVAQDPEPTPTLALVGTAADGQLAGVTIHTRGLTTRDVGGRPFDLTQAMSSQACVRLTGDRYALASALGALAGFRKFTTTKTVPIVVAWSEQGTRAQLHITDLLDADVPLPLVADATDVSANEPANASMTIDALRLGSWAEAPTGQTVSIEVGPKDAKGVRVLVLRDLSAPDRYQLLASMHETSTKTSPDANVTNAAPEHAADTP